MESPASQNQRLIKKMTNEVVDQIGRQIQQKIFGIGEQQRDVDRILEQKSELKKKLSEKEPKKAKTQRLNFEELEQIKKSKLVELKEIERTENIMKRSRLLSNSNVSKSFTKLQRSRFTDDQLKAIKEIMKKQRKFERSLQKKQENLKHWLELKRIQDEELKKKEILEQCQIRKKEIKVQRQELEQKKKERHIQYEQQIQKLKEVKEIKYLHEKLKEYGHQLLEGEMAEKFKNFMLEKQRRKIAVSNIQNHQKQYMQHKKQLVQKRQKQMGDSLTYSKSELPYVHSKFFFTIKKQQQEHAKIQEWERKMKQNNLSKQKLFSKQVKDLFLPKINPSNKLKIKEGHHKKSSLGHSEEHQLGNEYMKHAHGNITQDKKLQERKNQQLPAQQNGGYSAFYKNYLKDIRDSSVHKNSKINSRTLKGVLENPDQSEEKKLKKALKMLEQRDRQFSKNKNSDLVDSIKSKMLVLNQMIR